MRAVTSATPPAATLTMTRTGLLGHCCAWHRFAMTKASAKTIFLIWLPLLRLDAGILDDLAPGLHLGAHEARELLRTFAAEQRAEVRRVVADFLELQHARRFLLQALDDRPGRSGRNEK